MSKAFPSPETGPVSENSDFRVKGILSKLSVVPSRVLSKIWSTMFTIYTCDAGKIAVLFQKVVGSLYSVQSMFIPGKPLLSSVIFNILGLTALDL